MNKKVLFISEKLFKEQSMVELNVDPKVLKPVILEVQEVKLRQIIGNTLYNQLVEEYNAAESFDSLPIATRTLVLDYILPYMVYAVTIDFIVVNNYKVTNKGLLKLSDTNASNATPSETEYAKNYYEGRLASRKKALVTFLYDNKLLVPEADTNVTSAGIGWNIKPRGVRGSSSGGSKLELNENDPVWSADKVNYYLKSEVDALLGQIVISQADWNTLVNKPAAFPAAPHNHDDRYYTEAEVNALLAAKANVGHTHDWASITSKPSTFPADVHNHDDRYYTESEVDSKLNAKANTSHTHAIADVTGLQTALNSKAASAHNHNDLYYQKIEVDNALLGKQVIGNYETKDRYGVPGGYAPLDYGNKVPAEYLPSYVDDVVEANNMTVLQSITGERGKIYVTTDDGKTYRWSGSTYVEIASGAVNTVAGKTGYVTLEASDIQGFAQAARSSFYAGDNITIDANGIISATASGAPIAHTHAIADVTGLQTALDSKENILSFSNGLTKTLNAIELGGTVSKNTDLTIASGKGLYIKGGSPTYNGAIGFYGDYYDMVFEDSTNGISNYYGFGSNYLWLDGNKANSGSFNIRAENGKIEMWAGGPDNVEYGFIIRNDASGKGLYLYTEYSAANKSYFLMQDASGKLWKIDLANFATAVHTHTIANVTGLQAALDAKQATLVSGTNIATINGQSLLAGGDIVISGGGAVYTASNGLTLSGSDLQLGGLLSGDTTINAATATLSFYSFKNVMNSWDELESWRGYFDFNGFKSENRIEGWSTNQAYQVGAYKGHAAITAKARTSETIYAEVKVSDAGITLTGKTTASNDIEVTDLTKGVILKSPDGSRFRVTIDDNGALTSTKL
jgi:hypothetical protein